MVFERFFNGLSGVVCLHLDSKQWARPQMRIFLKRPLCLDGMGQFIVRGSVRSLSVYAYSCLNNFF